MIRAGDLDRQIVIVRAAPGTPDEFNEAPVTWPVFATVFAKFSQTGGREFFSAQEVMTERRATFLIRWRSDLLMTDQVQYGGLQWQLAELREIGRREGLELHAYVRA